MKELKLRKQSKKAKILVALIYIINKVIYRKEEPLVQEKE